MEEAQIKQIIERQPFHGSALLDPRCKILLLVCIGFVSYFLAGEVVSLALMLVYGLFIALGNGGKWAVKMIVTYIIVAYLNALLRYVQVPVLSGRLSQRFAPLCAGAGFECDYERIWRDGSETDPHRDDGTLDIADHLYGRFDGGSPADAAAAGGHDPSCGHVSLYPYIAD